MHAHPPVAQLSHLLCLAIKHYPSQPLRTTRNCLYIEDPFIPFCLNQPDESAQGVSGQCNNLRNGKFIATSNWQRQGRKVVFCLVGSLNDVFSLLFSGSPHSWAPPRPDLYLRVA